jgi:mono/diheme cytochrome c family protein
MRCVQRHLKLAAVAAALLTGSAAMAADAAKGKQAFVLHGCFQCHGYSAQGGVGPKLGPEPMPYEALANFVRTTSRQMPPYSEQILSNDDLADIYAFLQTIPASPDAKSIPLLNQ